MMQYRVDKYKRLVGYTFDNQVEQRKEDIFKNVYGKYFDYDNDTAYQHEVSINHHLKVDMYDLLLLYS